MSQVLVHDLQLLWEQTYSEGAVMRTLREEIPQELIEDSVKAILNFEPQYDTQFYRWNMLMDQDLNELFTELWCHLIRLDDITMTAVIAQTKYIIKGTTPLEAVKTMGEIIFLLAEADLLDLYRGIEDQWTVGCPVQFSEDILAKIDRIQYLPPMLCQPKKLKSWKDSGYLTIRDSGVILNNYMKTNGEYRLDNLDSYSNQILKLNMEFLLKFHKAVPEDKNQAQFLKDSWGIAADIVNAGNEFFMTYKYDKRGRQYAQGYHINPAGDSYHKAMIESTYSAKLTTEGLYWLKVDIANKYGLDKLPTFDARVAWVDQHIDHLEGMIDEVKDKNKPLYFKAVLALRDHQAGNPISHLGSLDAVFSGGQLWGVLTNCRKTCETVGLLGDECIDPYLALGECMDGEYSRDDLKYSIMPHFYGSSVRPEEIFEDDIEDFLELMETEMPGAEAGRNLLIDGWNPEALTHSWEMPDGFQVILPSMVKVEHRVTCLDGSSFTHVLNENQCKEHSVSLPANVIQSFDGYIVREMRRRLPAHVPLLANHDCFSTHPNFMHLLNPTYCSILSDLAASDALTEVFESLNIDAEISHDDYLIEALKHAKYALA